MRSFDRNLLADLHVFLVIVRRGSMVRAAAELGVTASALSHRIRKLEDDLGVRLLNRTSRSIRPTEAGAALAHHLSGGFQAIDDALSVLDTHRGEPAGRLRLNVLRDAAKLVLAPVLPEFFARYPNLQLDVIVDDRFVDVVGAGFDAGIRYGDKVPLDMIGIALTAPQPWVVVASPGLIARVGRPGRPYDLLNLPCIGMRLGDDRQFPWELGNGEAMVRLDVGGQLASNETEHTIDAALRGVGFAYCLERRVTSEVAAGTLEIVLPEWASDGPSFTIYYPSRRQMPSGLRQLIEAIRTHEGL